jgi:hypothetical protein
MGGPQTAKKLGNVKDENRRIRYLRILTDLTHQRLCVESMTCQEARDSVQDLRRAAARMFPGKESVFDLVIAPRLERVITGRFGCSPSPGPH